MHTMACDEFDMWQAYHQVEPFGFPVDDFRAGQLNANIVKYSGHSRRTDFVSRDFMINPPPPQEAAPAAPGLIQGPTEADLRAWVEATRRRV